MGQPLFQSLFGIGPKVAQSSAQAMPGQKALNPWSFQSIMQSPYTKFGLNMLEQAGPKSAPSSTGQDIARSFAGMQQDEDAQSAKQFRDMQLEMMRRQQEAAMRQLSFLDPNGAYNGGMSASTPPSYGY